MVAAHIFHNIQVIFDDNVLCITHNIRPTLLHSSMPNCYGEGTISEVVSLSGQLSMSLSYIETLDELAIT